MVLPSTKSDQLEQSSQSRNSTITMNKFHQNHKLKKVEQKY